MPRTLPALRELLLWDEATFIEQMKGSPMRRLKLPRFKRNVCVVLGNIGAAEDLPALTHVASQADIMVAEHAVWAIEEIKQSQRELK